MIITILVAIYVNAIVMPMFRSTAFQYHENHWPEDVFTRAKQNVSKKAVPSFNQKLLSQSALRPPSFLFFLKAMSQHSTLVIYLLKKESVPSFHYHMVHLCLCNKIALVYGPSSAILADLPFFQKSWDFHQRLWPVYTVVARAGEPPKCHLLLKSAHFCRNPLCFSLEIESNCCAGEARNTD